MKYILGLLVGLFLATSVGVAGDSRYVEKTTYRTGVTYYTNFYSLNDADSISCTLIAADSIDVDTYAQVKFNSEPVNSLDSIITYGVDSLAGTARFNLTIKTLSVDTYSPKTQVSARFKLVFASTGMQATTRKPLQLIIRVYNKH